MQGRLHSDVVVIGGGATGAGIARDLTLRGLKVVLVERRDIAAGATGRCHGLLHSGVRYAVKDPTAAKECIEENLLLKNVAREAIEDTEGLMVFLRGDDPGYLERWVINCQEIGIEVHEIPCSRALCMEPNISPDMERAFVTPDASVDPFLLTLENVRAARRRGALIMRHSLVVNFELRGTKITGVRVRHEGEEAVIDCEIAVIAAGAWGDEIARMAGVQVPLSLSKGSLLIMNHRLNHRVLNRLRMPSDADLVIPNGPTSIIGTTSVSVSSPDNLKVDPGEVDILIGEGKQLIPSFAYSRALRGYAGVRPLYRDPEATGDGRDITRGFSVLDHEAKDGVEGLVSIVGGKLTTYRLMAEKASDLVCKKLGLTSLCTTRAEHLFDKGSRKYYSIGQKLGNMEKGIKGWDPVICECEMVTKNEILKAYEEIDRSINLADIQHRTRMGMGPCQGGFCALRAAGLLAGEAKSDFPAIDKALRSFLNERWKGIYPLLWGEELREEYLNYGVYAGLFNLDKIRSEP